MFKIVILNVVLLFFISGCHSSKESNGGGYDSDVFTLIAPARADVIVNDNGGNSVGTLLSMNSFSMILFHGDEKKLVEYKASVTVVSDTNSLSCTWDNPCEKSMIMAKNSFILRHETSFYYEKNDCDGTPYVIARGNIENQLFSGWSGKIYRIKEGSRKSFIPKSKNSLLQYSTSGCSVGTGESCPPSPPVQSGPCYKVDSQNANIYFSQIYNFSNDKQYVVKLDYYEVNEVNLKLPTVINSPVRFTIKE